MILKKYAAEKCNYSTMSLGTPLSNRGCIERSAMHLRIMSECRDKWSMVKNAIERGQSRTCSGYAEREHFI